MWRTPKMRVRSWWSRASSAPSASWATWNSVVDVKWRKSAAPIQTASPPPSSESGGHHTMTAVTPTGRAPTSSHGRRRPRRERVRSDR
jgi:hypothetical protein